MRNLVVALAVLLVGSHVIAQVPCGSVSYPVQSCAPVYSKPVFAKPVVAVADPVVVSYPVPFTVAVPVVSYLFNGGGYSYQPLAAQPLTPVAPVAAQPVVGGPAPVAGAAPVAAPQQQARVAAPPPPVAADPGGLTDAQIDSLINRIEARLAARQKAGAPPPPQPGAEPPAGSAPPPVAGIDVTQVLLTKRGNLGKSCADCHTGATSKGNTVIFSPEGVLNPQANWNAIWDASDAGRMPPEARTNRNALVSDAEVAALKTRIPAR
jgi:hypothetical protein